MMGLFTHCVSDQEVHDGLLEHELSTSLEEKGCRACKGTGVIRQTQDDCPRDALSYFENLYLLG